MTPAEATEHAKLYMELRNAKELLRKLKKASGDQYQNVTITDYYISEIKKITDGAEILDNIEE